MTWSSALLDQVDKREDSDPHDVDEVPVQRGEIDVEGVLGAQPATIVYCKQGEQPDHAGGDVRAVKPGQREEGGTKQVRADREALVHERGELECLEPEEGCSENRRHPEP